MKKTNKRLPTMPRPQLKRRRKAPEERLKEAFANVPKITNETVAEHREDVLAGARKFIYPLKHSRRRTVTISTTIFIVAMLIFMTYVTVSLYRFQSTSSFLYGVTKVLPLPVAKAGSSWISYNSYLFELRHYMHYYETQQGVDFDTDSGKEQLENYKKQAMQQVITDAYVKQLAKEHRVKVTNREVTNQIELMRSQNRIGTSQREFEEVLNEFWGWNEADFRRSLHQQMVAQAVVAKLDTETVEQANAALTQLKSGADFATLATQVSEDEGSKAAGGQYGSAIDRNNADIPAQVMRQLFILQPGQYSEVINTGFSLEIVRVNSVQDAKVQASHISFVFKPISDYIKPLKNKQPARDYINI